MAKKSDPGYGERGPTDDEEEEAEGPPCLLRGLVKRSHGTSVLHDEITLLMLYAMGSRFRYRSRAAVKFNGDKYSSVLFFFFLLLSSYKLVRKFIPVEINLVIGKYEAEQIDSLLVIFIVFCTNNR